MLRRAVVVLIALSLLAMPVLGVPRTAHAQGVTCANYDAWIWAQTVFESDKARYAALDPDGDGLACPELSIQGFAPVLWTSTVPADAEAARITSITDGDTFHVSINGQPDTIRMYHMNTPETHDPRRGVQCGGEQATAYLQYIFSLIPNQTVSLEYDVTKRDKYDRRLAYVWFKIGGDVYMVNEAMVRTGWAESTLYKPDNKYGAQLDAAEQFSVEHVLGVRLACGKFGQPVGSQPSAEQVRQAMSRQPNQGQFAALAGGAQAQATQPVSAGAAAGSDQGSQPAPAQTAGNCDPSYPTVCIPPPPPDLDCKDIPYRQFPVLPPDPHGFDGNHNGIGCESG